MRRLILAPCALAAALAAAPAALAAPQTILPGWWEYTTSSVGGSGTDRRCIRPEEIERFVESPGTRHYHCTYPERSIGGGRASYKGVCVSKHGKSYPVTLSGTYTPTSMDLKGSAQPIAGIPVTLPATIKARRLSPTCPEE